MLTYCHHMHLPSFFFHFFCWIFKDLNKDESATQLIEGGRVALAGDVVFLIDVSNSVADYGCQSIDQLNERINQFTRGVFNRLLFILRTNWIFSVLNKRLLSTPDTVACYTQWYISKRYVYTRACAYMHHAHYTRLGHDCKKLTFNPPLPRPYPIYL